MSRTRVEERSPAAFASMAPAAAGGRYRAVDALRGVIMILMAIDHASAFIARQHASEFWAGAMSAYTGAFPFLTRWITHLCAPGFFFLMGAGIYWSAAGKAAGVRRTLWRGFVLLLTAQVFEIPVLYLQSSLKPAAVSLNQITAPPPNDGSALYWGLVTLSGLGLVMMACGLMLRLRPWVWLVVSALCVVATNTLLPASGQPGSLWVAVLLAPGLADHVIVLYPLIPWLAGAAAGMYFGRWWRNHPADAGRRVWILGALLLLAALALRALGGWGNIRPPRDGGWIEFLNNVKYPPSLVFWTMSLGINLLLLGLLARLPEKVKPARSPLMVFGQTPLFFYILHFYVLAAMAFIFFRNPAPLGAIYPVWAVALAVLYPMCLWYGTFKRGKPAASLWRLF